MIMVLFGVSYKVTDDTETYEIFTTQKEAERFYNSINEPVGIFKADFNSDRVFEEEGELNYDDKADTYDAESRVKIL